MQNGVKKPYIKLMGKPILTHTLEVLYSIADIDSIIIPVFPGEEPFCEKEVIQQLLPGKRSVVIAGGETRQESVGRSLEHVPENCDIVLIHDGARPLISPRMIEHAIDATEKHGATTMGVPVKDTITMVSRTSHTITETLARDSLYSIQTPQTFRRDVIVEAHQKARQDCFAGTDDASLVERIGIPVKVIMGAYTNIKITTAEDLLFAEAILQGRGRH